MKMRLFVILVLAACAAGTAAARTSNGNEFALYYSEAGTDAERNAVFDEAKGRPHFFRYLQIMEIETVTNKQGRIAIHITAFEPSSLMDVVFTVDKPVSLSKIIDAPVSKLGDAVAVTGRVVEADKKKNTIRLDPVIVRHKDRLSPAAGKEMHYETNPDGKFYSFTDGPRPINLSYRDRDLLQHRDAILDGQGPKAWCEFLERELKRRKEERAKTGTQ